MERIYGRERTCVICGKTSRETKGVFPRLVITNRRIVEIIFITKIDVCYDCAEGTDPFIIPAAAISSGGWNRMYYQVFTKYCPLILYCL